MLRRAAREGGVAAGQKLQMRQVRARHAERLFVFATQPATRAKLLAAFRELRIATNYENNNFVLFFIATGFGIHRRLDMAPSYNRARCARSNSAMTARKTALNRNSTSG